MRNIHETAIVDPKAEIGDDVAIGPYCIVGPNVRVGNGCTLHSHVVVNGTTHLGEECQVYSFAALGYPPQDLKYNDEPNRLLIGDRCIIREHATLHPGTANAQLTTRVGNDCFILVGAHVAHDCILGNNVTLINNATMGGHVHIADFAMLGGMCAIHQFVRIGEHAFIGGMSGVENDVIPFGMVMGNRARLSGLNLVGLKRRGYDRERIHTLRVAYRNLFAPEGTLKERMQDVEEAFPDEPLVGKILEFIRVESPRALCTPTLAPA